MQRFSRAERPLVPREASRFEGEKRFRSLEIDQWHAETVWRCAELPTVLDQVAWGCQTGPNFDVVLASSSSRRGLWY